MYMYIYVDIHEVVCWQRQSVCSLNRSISHEGSSHNMRERERERKKRDSKGMAFMDKNFFHITLYIYKKKVCPFSYIVADISL